jgi:hypothetical protein
MRPSAKLAAVVALYALIRSPLPALGEGQPAKRDQRQQCIRKMRHLFEAIQAYRRVHNGEYPEKFSALVDTGIISGELALCPCVLESRQSSSRPGGTWSSIGEGFDSNLAYQYEMSAKPIPDILLAEGATATWREMKTALLRRPFWEDIPLIRCERHSDTDERLNVSFAGHGYGSPTNWEHLFVDKVPYTYRAPYLAFRRNVPPFAPAGDSGVPTPNSNVSLAVACNSFPADPWWWGSRVFLNGKPALTLQPLLDECSAGILRHGDDLFDVRYLVQTQGVTVPREKAGRGFISTCFPKRVMFPVNRIIREAVILSATVWEDQPGRAAGAILWHYADGTRAEFPLITGENIGCFRGSPTLSTGVSAFWSSAGPTAAVCLFGPKWTNPHPQKAIVKAELVADAQSPAAPFIIAISVTDFQDQ